VGDEVAGQHHQIWLNSITASDRRLQHPMGKAAPIKVKVRKLDYRRTVETGRQIGDRDLDPLCGQRLN